MSNLITAPEINRWYTVAAIIHGIIRSHRGALQQWPCKKPQHVWSTVMYVNRERWLHKLKLRMCVQRYVCVCCIWCGGSHSSQQLGLKPIAGGAGWARSQRKQHSVIQTQPGKKNHPHTCIHTHTHRCTDKRAGTSSLEHTHTTHTHLICSIFAVRAHLQTYAQPRTIYKAVQECCRCLHPFAQQVNLHGGIILSLWDAFQIHSSACDSSYNINTLSSAYLKQR